MISREEKLLHWLMADKLPVHRKLGLMQAHWHQVYIFTDCKQQQERILPRKWFLLNKTEELPTKRNIQSPINYLTW